MICPYNREEIPGERFLKYDCENKVGSIFTGIYQKKIFYLNMTYLQILCSSSDSKRK